MNIELLDMIEHFARVNKLKVRIADYNIVEFVNDEGKVCRYGLKDDMNTSEFPKIVQEVNEFFGLVKHDPEPLPVAKPTAVVEQHRTDICGLSKHEYMALELTKAWASTRCNGHEYCDEIVSTYEKMLKEIKARNL